MVHFWGGEPLMGDAHIKFLKELKEKNILKNCRIQYNTNGTHRVSEEVLSLWSEAHLVELYFSIDDIDERFNYIRTGADWDEVKSNLDWFKENLPSNHLLYVNVVWSYLNVYYLPELYNWFNENFNETLSGDPIKVNRQHAFGVCHVDTLTQEQYKHLEEKLSGPEFKPILKEIKIGSDISLKFKEYINKLDTIRNMNYRKTFPEWGALLGV
jgi:MoaA/NifB/PqqE/SkfB family radical SAM enzyme